MSKDNDTSPLHAQAIQDRTNKGALGLAAKDVSCLGWLAVLFGKRLRVRTKPDTPNHQKADASAEAAMRNRAIAVAAKRKKPRPKKKPKTEA